MAQRIRLAIYDHSNTKLCDIQDSTLNIQGQAQSPQLSRSRDGTKELSFVLPFYVDGEKNFRWDYIKPEYKVKQVKGTREDWFVIDSPVDNHSDDLTEDVSCSHCSNALKTRNIYLTFDDTNGIGTMPELLDKILNGTGWTAGELDVMLENDGKTEKIRSLTTTSAGKEGARQLITKLCNLFNAYPVFNGDTYTVDIHANKNRTGYVEINYGKNLKSIKRTKDSTNIVTRLYVEGNYDDDSYVGIDDVNPTGLTFLLNFDYYREIGMFKQEHEDALNQYLTNIQVVKAEIKTNSTERERITSQLNALWGPIEQTYWPIVEANLGSPILFGGAEEEDAEIKTGDEIIIGLPDGTYSKIIAEADGGITVPVEALFAFKYCNKHGGTIGGKEIGIESKEKMIDTLNKDLDKTADENRRKYISDQITELENGIRDLYNGTEESKGLYDLFFEAIDLSLQLNTLNEAYNTLSMQQLTIEAVFTVAMGDMLRDGYWSDTDYIAGQEQYLYNDALEVSAEMGKPAITYSVTALDLGAMGLDDEPFDLNYSCRIYDKDAGINDYVFVDKITEYFDEPENNKLTLSSKEMDIGAQTFEAMMSRITQITDMIIGRNSLYERAQAISKEGTIGAEILNGNINVEKQRLVSAVSNWQTDENGNILFVALDGSSAMMLAGEGFMIANGKDENGNWNWRTFGTGRGFTADMIVTGFLSADRILTGSITAQKLSGDVGANIDISNNATIQLLEDQISMKVSRDEIGGLIGEIGAGMQVGDEPPQEPANYPAWLDTGVEPSVLRRWTGNATDVSRSYDVAVTGETLTINDIALGHDILITASEDCEVTHNANEPVVVAANIITLFKAEVGGNEFTASSGILTAEYEGTGWEIINDNYLLEQRVAEAEFRVTPESIVGTVLTSEEYAYDLSSKADLEKLNQFISAVEESFTLQEESMSELELTANDLTLTFNTLRETVTSYEGDLRVIEENLNANFKFSDDGFQIWRTTSDFNIRIDNEEMGFYQGNQKVAYINNSRLYITSAQVEKDLSIGSFVFKIEVNNSLSIQYLAK